MKKRAPFSGSTALLILSTICLSSGTATADAAGTEVRPTASAKTSFQKELDQIEEKIAKSETSDALYAELEKIISAEPTNFRAHLLLGNCYDALGLPDQATEEYKLATKYGPDQPKAFVEALKAQIRMGQMKSAMEMLTEAQRKFPNDPEVQFWVGNYLFSKNRRGEAETAYMMALKQQKKILGLASALAEVRLQQGRFGEAYFLADIDTTMQPSYALANRIKGTALMKLGRYDQAVKPFQYAYIQAPFKPNVAEYYARCCFWSGDYKQALSPALVSLALTSSLDSNNPQEKNFLIAIIRKVSDDFLLEQMRRLEKNLGNGVPAAYHFALGDVLDKTGKHGLAVEQYRAGLIKEPTFARGWFRLGQDLEKYYRNYDKAMICYQRADGYKPGDSEISMSLLSLSGRMANHSRDWSWHLKNMLRRPAETIELPPLQKAQSQDSTQRPN